jgi:hypothetical protein
MPNTREKKHTLAPEIAVVDEHGQPVSDAEVWKTILGDDVCPWDVSCEELLRRHNLSTVPDAPQPTRRRSRKTR